MAHSTNWRFKNLFNQLGAVWLAFKVLYEPYRCQCRLILKYWDCVYTIDKVWLHPLCTWCPPPTRSWGGKCRFSFCSSSQSAVIQLEGFTGQHDPPCMLMLLLHMSSSNYMTLTTPLILFLALCFLALDHPGLPNYTKWGRTEENCSVSGKVVFFHMNFLFIKKCLKFSLSSLKQLQIDFFSYNPGQTRASLRGCEVCQPRPSEGQNLWFLCFQLFCFFSYFYKGFHLYISRSPSLMRSRPTSKQLLLLPTQLISSILEIGSSSQVFFK